jgi:preprotein translocase subunit Sec63
MPSDFEYDESNSSFAVFVTTFIGLYVIPATIRRVSAGVSKLLPGTMLHPMSADECARVSCSRVAATGKGSKEEAAALCQCAACVDKQARLTKSKPRVPVSGWCVLSKSAGLYECARADMRVADDAGTCSTW